MIYNRIKKFLLFLTVPDHRLIQNTLEFMAIISAYFPLERDMHSVWLKFLFKMLVLILKIRKNG